MVDMEALKGMKTMPDNMYPVALLRDMEGNGYDSSPNYTAAAAIGLSIAGLGSQARTRPRMNITASLKKLLRRSSVSTNAGE